MRSQYEPQESSWWARHWNELLQNTTSRVRISSVAVDQKSPISFYFALILQQAIPQLWSVPLIKSPIGRADEDGVRSEKLAYNVSFFARARFMIIALISGVFSASTTWKSFSNMASASSTFKLAYTGQRHTYIHNFSDSKLFYQTTVSIYRSHFFEPPAATRSTTLRLVTVIRPII